MNKSLYFFVGKTIVWDNLLGKSAMMSTAYVYYIRY